MKLSSIILSEIYDSTSEYRILIQKLKNKGAEHLGSGDYGSAWKLNGKVYKVTTDDIELDHAKRLKGLDTRYFAKIYDVKTIKSDLGIIEMEILSKTSQKPSKNFLKELEIEAQNYNIDPLELDYNSENFMEDNTGNLKMIDV